MKKLIKIVLLLAILFSIVSYLDITNRKNKIDTFYRQLENAILHRMLEVKNDFAKKDSLEGKIIWLSDIRETSTMTDPGSTFYSEREKDTIVNYGATYETINVYDIMIELHNKSGYELDMYYIQTDPRHLRDFVTIKNNESINSIYVIDEYKYNDNIQVVNESLYISEKIKFKYKYKDIDKYIEIPVRMNVSLSICVDENSIKEVIVNDVKTSIYTRQTSVYPEGDILKSKIKSVFNINESEDDLLEYLRDIELELDNNLDENGSLIDDKTKKNK